MKKLDSILARLLTLHPRKIDLSLGRTQNLLDAVGNPERKLPRVIHVAGTNGKGSTIAFLRAMLEASGARVHVYISPHLVRFNERIRLAGTLVDDATLIDALEICERVNAGAPITFFEITTAAAFLLFAQHPADWLLLETGLGGRFDSTNVVADPAATIITPVSIDHVEFLGPTIAAIAGEKAGIFKQSVPAILAPQNDEALNVLERAARRLNAPIRLAERDFYVREESGRLIYDDEDGLLDLPLPRLPGRHQHNNAATAIAALRRIAPEIGAAAIEAGILNARWPARLQNLSRGPLAALAPQGSEVWLDGGHNVDGARVVAMAMSELQDRANAPLVLICGTLATKDVRGFLSAFAGLAQRVIAVPIAGEHQGRPAQDVADAALAEGMAASVASSVADALRIIAAQDWPAPPRVLIAGSLYLAGQVLSENDEVIV